MPEYTGDRTGKNANEVSGGGAHGRFCGLEVSADTVDSLERSPELCLLCCVFVATDTVELLLFALAATLTLMLSLLVVDVALQRLTRAALCAGMNFSPGLWSHQVRYCVTCGASCTRCRCWTLSAGCVAVRYIILGRHASRPPAVTARLVLCDTNSFALATIVVDMVDLVFHFWRIFCG